MEQSNIQFGPGLNDGKGDDARTAFQRIQANFEKIFAAFGGGVATLDSFGKVPVSQLPDAVLGGLNYRGVWNAATNSPALASGVGSKGYYYKVSVAGGTAIDGISTWNVGDWIVFNGATWDKLDGLAADVLSVAGLTGTIGAVALKAALAIAAGDVSGLGPLATAYATPPAPSRIGQGTLASGGFQPAMIFVRGRYAYVTEGGTTTNGFEIFDISNPASPVRLSQSALANGNASHGGGAAIFVLGDYAYIAEAAGTANAFEIFNIANPSAPVRVGQANLANGGSGFAINGIWVKGGYAYIVEGDGTTNAFEVFDVSNPAAPARVSQTSLPGTGAAIYIHGRYAYIVSGDATNTTLSIFDITTPSAPSLVGSQAVLSFGVACGCPSIYVQGGFAYVACGGYVVNALNIFNVSNPAAPTRVGVKNLTGGAWSSSRVFVQGRYAYVVSVLETSGANCFQVFDISDPSAPVLINSSNLAYGANSHNAGPDIFVQGRYAYIVEGGGTANAFEIFDLGGVYVQQAEIGGLEVGTLAVRNVAMLKELLAVTAGDVADASANGRSLMTAANYAAMKTLLAIAAGDVSGLGSLATASSVTASQISDASANGRSLITAANYAAMKTLLALVVGDVSGAAPLASPALTGTPSAPTPGAGDNSTKLATTAYLDRLIGAASGLATLDGGGKLSSAQIPASLLGAVVYQGVWNATTNSPALASGVGTKGYYYKVGTAGNTTIDGNAQWNVGDSIIFDGTTWDKIDGITNEVVSVAGLYGAITAAALKTALAIAAGDVSGLAASATTDTTNAANISSGALPAGRLPNPAASTLGGVKSLAAASHKFLTQIDTAGLPSAAQPAVADISGLLTTTIAGRLARFTDTAGTQGQTAGLFEDGSGNVGVGITDPQVKLQGQTSGTIRFGFATRTDGGTIGGVASGQRARVGGWYGTHPIPGSCIEFAGQGGAGQRGCIGFYVKNVDDDTTTPTLVGVFDQNGNFGVGTSAPTSPSTVAGIIESTSGGFKFPDASVQATAAAPIPTSSALPVGWSGMMRYTGVGVTDGSTCAGSALTIPHIKNTATAPQDYADGAAQTGTWKNITGVNVSGAGNDYGLFVRTA